MENNEQTSWSVDGQSPAFLAATRMVSLADAVVESVSKHLGLQPGMNVLDVGCGSGEYCFRLGSKLEGIRFTGIDRDERFIGFAGNRASGSVGYPFELPNPANGYRFVCGDACRMPFADATFDAIISHTFLTAVADWRRALDEMRRVCKPGGVVSSITSMTDNFYGTGSIGLLAGSLAPEDAALVERVKAAKARVFKNMNLVPGVQPRDVPSAFWRAGFSHVRCLPVAQYFCLDDEGFDIEERRRHVELLYLVEKEELLRLCDAAKEDALLSRGDLDRFARLIERRREDLLAMSPDNYEWNWYGNAALLVSGVCG